MTACAEAAAERKATVAPKAFSQETEDTLALAAGLALTITFQQPSKIQQLKGAFPP